MKTITLIFSLLITTAIWSQEVFRLDSTLVQNWEAATDEWMDNIKNHFYYDDDNLNDTRVYQFMYSNNSWDSISRETKMYTNDNLTESTFESYDGSQWNYNTRKELTYNGSDQITLEENYLFTDIWLKNSSQENSYDINSGNITEELFKTLDFISGVLVNDKRNLFAYNATDLLEQEVFQTWLGTMWFNQIRHDHFYLPNDLVDYIDRFDWLGNSWSTIQERNLFFYNDDDLVSEIRKQTDNGSVLENDSRVLNTYDASPNLIQITGQEWNGSGWDNLSNLIQNYDSDDNIEEQISQIWDFPNSEWLNQIRVISYWSLTESLSVSFINPLDVNIYPNPTKDILQVQLSEASNHNLEVILFDISGRKLNTLLIDKGTTIFKIPITQQAPGTYFLRINNKGRTQIFRIIKS